MDSIGSGIPPWTKLFNNQQVLHDIVVKMRKELPHIIRSTTSSLLEEHGVKAGNITQGTWRTFLASECVIQKSSVAHM